MDGHPMSAPVELYACVYVTEFPAQTLLRLRTELREKAFVVIEGEPPLQIVCSFNSKARRMGIARGMTKVELDMFPSVTVLPRSLKEEAATKVALLECARAFSPRTENRSDHHSFVCVIDIAGTEKLLGPPRVLTQNLLLCVKALGISACATVSSNFFAADCLARGTTRPNVTIIPHGQESIALAPLSLSVLNLSNEDAETFASWGIYTLGMLAALPERELIARMGQEGKRLHQLARGELPHLFVPIEPEFRLQEHMELDSPVELLDSLLFVVGVMIQQLITRATARVLALATVTITLFLESGLSHTRTVRPALPSNEKQLWIKLLHLDLEAHPPSAPILSLDLTAEPGSTSKVQLGLFSPQLPEPDRLDVTLARIRSIVGDECVGSPVLKDTHQPNAFRMEAFSVSSITSANEITRTTSVMRQLRPAESVSVTLCNQRPTGFSFRHKRYKVEHVYGPWTAAGEWWSPMLWELEQCDLIACSNDGSLLCCCLVRDVSRNIYQIVGLYD
jgi:protein ImuB